MLIMAPCFKYITYNRGLRLKFTNKSIYSFIKQNGLDQGFSTAGSQPSSRTWKIFNGSQQKNKGTLKNTFLSSTETKLVHKKYFVILLFDLEQSPNHSWLKFRCKRGVKLDSIDCVLPTTVQ
jgi:hypothetical protein